MNAARPVLPLAAFLGALLWSALANAATLYVPEEFRDLSAALAVAVEGDTIKLGEGTWYEDVRVPEGVTVEGVHPARSVIHGTSPDSTVVTLAHGATLLGVAVTGGRIGVLADAPYMGDPPDSTVEGCIVFGMGRSGVEARGGVRVVVRGSTIADNDLWGVYASSEARLEVRTTLLIGNGTGVEAEGATLEFLYNSIVTHNRSAGVVVHGPDYWGRVVNNTIVANDSAGVRVEGASTVEFRHNIVGWNVHGFYNVSGDAAVTVDRNDVYANEEADWVGIDPGDANMSADPMFVRFDPEGDGWDDDLHLMPGSPCIDAADDALAYQDPDETVGDLGAYGGPGSGPVGAGVRPEDVEIEVPAAKGCRGCGGGGGEAAAALAILLLPARRRR